MTRMADGHEGYCQYQPCDCGVESADALRLESRVKALERGLRRYGEHLHGVCMIPKTWASPEDMPQCTCGLRALLAGEEEMR